MLTRLLKLVYAVVALKGLLTALAPRRVLGLIFATWRLGLKNTDELKPREWYVSAVRATGVGMLAAGGVGLLLLDDEDDALAGDHGDGSGDSGSDSSGDDGGDTARRTDDEGVESIDISPDE